MQNNEGDLISIIIPVYNVEKYLDECINSVVNQTYQNTEILLIEDGSTDTSPEICAEWKKRDSRIKVWHQKNRGVSSARNKGMEMAGGKYLLFVDADDYIDEAYVQGLYEKLDIADIVICGYSRVTETQRQILIGKEGFLSREDLFYHAVCTNIVHGAAWNKIFRKNIIENKKIRFHENIAVGEDMVFVIEYLQYCRSYYYVNSARYFYRKNEQSVMNDTYSSRQFNKKNLTSLKCISQLENITGTENKMIQNYIKYRAVRSSIRLMLQMVIGNYADNVIFKRIQMNCQKNYLSYVAVKAGTFLERIVGFLLCISPNLVYQGGKFVISRELLSLGKYME